MIKRSLLTVALTLIVAMSSTACSGISSQAAKAEDFKSLFDVDSSDDDRKAKDDDDDREDDDKKDRDDDEEEEEKEDKDDKDDKEDKEDKEDKDDKDDEDDDEDSSGLSEKEIKKKLGDSVDTCKVGIEDAVYELPAKVSEFEKNGWEIDEANSNEFLDAERLGHLILQKGSKYLYLGVENFDDYTIEAADAAVTSIAVQDDFGTEMYLAGGLKSSMKHDEIKDTVEDLDDVFEYDEDSYYNKFTFEGKESQIFIETFTKNDKIHTMELYANITDKSDYEGAPKADIDTDEDADADVDYSAPSKISGVSDFETDGNVYSLGAPVSAFLENGWELEEGVNTDNQISAGKSGGAILVKDDMRVQLHVNNEGNSTVSVKNATVESFRTVDNGDFEIIGGVKDGDKVSDVKDALDDKGIDYDEADNYISFRKDGVYVFIAVKDGKTTNVTIDAN